MPSEASVRADLLGDAAVGRGGEAVAAVLLRDRHAEGAELGEALHDLRRHARARARSRPASMWSFAKPRKESRNVDTVSRSAASISGNGKTVSSGICPGEEGLDDGNEAGIRDGVTGESGSRHDVISMVERVGGFGVEARPRVGQLAEALGGREPRAQALGEVVEAREDAVGAERRRRSAAGRRGTAGSPCRRSSRGRAWPAIAHDLVLEAEGGLVDHGQDAGAPR